MSLWDSIEGSNTNDWGSRPWDENGEDVGDFLQRLRDTGRTGQTAQTWNQMERESFKGRGYLENLFWQGLSRGTIKPQQTNALEQFGLHPSQVEKLMEIPVRTMPGQSLSGVTESDGTDYSPSGQYRTDASEVMGSLVGGIGGPLGRLVQKGLGVGEPGVELTPERGDTQRNSKTLLHELLHGFDFRDQGATFGETGFLPNMRALRDDYNSDFRTTVADVRASDQSDIGKLLGNQVQDPHNSFGPSELYAMVGAALGDQGYFRGKARNDVPPELLRYFSELLKPTGQKNADPGVTASPHPGPTARSTPTPGGSRSAAEMIQQILDAIPDPYRYY